MVLLESIKEARQEKCLSHLMNGSHRSCKYIMNIDNEKTSMQEEETDLKKSVIFNIPNRITLSRLFLAIVVFCFTNLQVFQHSLCYIFNSSSYRLAGWISCKKMGIVYRPGTAC